MPFEPEWLYLDELLPLLGPSPDLARVEAVVSRALDEGRLQDRTFTSAHAWHERFEQADGKFGFDWTSGVMVIPYWDRGREYQLRPIRPQFRRADFLALFEMASKEAVEITSKKTASKAVSEPTFRRWYKERYDHWPEGQKASNREEDEVAAREKFPGLTRERFRKARKDLAPEWTEGGRPSSKLVDENLAEYLAEKNLAENLAENPAENLAKKVAGD